MKNFIFDLQKFDDVTLVIGDYTFGSGNTTLTPSTGVVDIALKRGKTTILSGELECTSGKITLGDEVTFAKGTNLNLTLNKDGKTIFDGNLNVNGTIYLDNNVLTVAKGTEFNIDFGDNYLVSLKATDDAGGKISFGENGITFAPNSDDGGLDISVTRDGETRKATMNVSGSITYKLDGSISLIKDTVVKNIFEDGNILTLTAKSDASGSIVLSPQNGLEITPNKSDALDILLSRDGEDVIEISEITGPISYKGGGFTASDGTDIHFVDPAGIYNDNVLRTSGGSTTVHFGENGIDYTPGENATFTMDYLEGTTWELQNGTLTDYFSGPVQGTIYLSEGSIFDTNDNEFPFVLEKAGEYTLNGVKITTATDGTEATMSGYDTVTFAKDAGVTISTIEGGKLFEVSEGDDTIQISTSKFGDLTVSNGTITLDDTTLSATAGTTVTHGVTTFTADKDISADYKVEEEIYYYEVDDDTTAKVSVTSGEKTISGDLNLGGVVSYRPETGTFGLTGANSSHGNGENTFAEFTFDNGYSFKMQTSNTTIVFIPQISDGKLAVNFPNERKHELKFTLGKDGQTFFENNIIVDGTVGFDPTKQEISLKKDTSLTLGNDLVITALDDAGGQITFVDGGIKFSPNEGDGALELNFVSAERKANLNITGAVIFGANNKISLEDGTEIDITWEDGNNLKLTSSGSTGSIEFDAEKGIKITSDDENLDMELTMNYGYSTKISSVEGSLWYNAGKAVLDEGTKLTGTGTLNNQAVNVTLETADGDAYLDFSTSEGFIYGAGTGNLKVTYALDEKESTFTVNKGSVLIGTDILKIAEGSDVATDLKDFMPAMNFITEDAGTYTINGQTITTTAENLALKATDNYMSFVTSDDVVEYDGMTFAGEGNVSLTPDNVVLGEGVAASGFGEENSFVLAEAGNVTADAKIFELTELQDLPREIPMKITVQGAKDGFIFSRTLTKESEAYLDDALDEENFENYTSPYIGKVFTEKFTAAGDSSYRIRTDAIGLEEVIGISDGATINGGAILDNEPSLSYYNLVTDTEGKFTIGEKIYNISGDSNVAIRARFEVDNAPYASYVDSLNGTVSGDFTGGQFSINGSSGMQVLGDSNVDIIADENGFEISGLDEGAGLQVSSADTYTVNGTALEADAGDIIIGAKDSAYISENTAGLSITNFDNDSIITATNFADTIENHGDNVKINSFGGKDTVTNFGASSIIDTGADNDNIINGGASVTINGGAGNDTITNDGANSTVNGAEGDDNISNSADDVLIMGGYGNDTIQNAGANATIKPGGGHDNISNLGENVLIDYTGGSDTISGLGENSTLKIAGDYDTMEGIKSVVVQSGDDFVILENALLNTDAININDEKIELSKVIDLTYEGENISVNRDNVTVSGNGGDDTITNSGENVFFNYAEGDGNDIIFGFNETSTLNLSDADYISIKSGDDIIVTVGENTITLKDAEGGHIVGRLISTEEFITNVMGSSAKVVILKSGEQNLDLNTKNYNVVVVPEDATGEKNISLSGGNLAVVEDTNAQVSITASAGDDTIASQGENVFVNLNDGATKIYVHSGKMTVDNYNPATGAGFFTDYEDIFTAMDANKILYDGTTLTIGSAEVTDGTSGNNLVNVYDTSGKLQKLGSVQPNNELNLSDEKDNFIVGVGENATFTGGAGNDSIFAFADSHVDGGEGVNYISLEERDENTEGVEIAFNASSKNTVDNFQTGFDENSDKVFLGVDDVTNFKIADADLMIRKPNNSHCGVLKDVAASASSVNILAADENSTQKVTVIREGAKIKVDDELANLYNGENSGVDFTNYADDLTVNLGTTKAESVGSGEILFGGINQVTLGSGAGILLGSNVSETLTAGTGASTISGGAGADKLVGKNGGTTFLFSAGDENDTISNFNFGTDIIYTDGEIQNVGTSGNNVIIYLNDEDKLTIENGARNNFNINVGDSEFSASVTSGDLTYNSDVNYYNTSKNSASISATANAEEITMWLNGDENLKNTLGDGVQFVGDIKYISAAKSGGSALLAGNENIDNVITASKGNSTLWGGGASNDTLIGGAGVDEFYYMRGNGADVIQNATAGDVVILDGMEMSDITSTEVNGSAVVLNFNDGGSLTLNSNNGTAFKLEGATYTYNKSAGEWQKS